MSAVFMGICAAVALPPLYGLPLIIPAFAGLFLLVQGASSRRQAFLDGWWWGLGYFVAGLYWICISLFVEPEKFAWLTPFALFGLPSVLAIYIGLVTWLLKSSEKYIMNPTRLIVLFAALWVIVEYARGHLLSGFSWNFIGYVWTVSDMTIQFASVTGIYGLSWVAVIAGAMPALFFFEQPLRRPLLVSVVLLAGMMLFGWWRLEHAPTQYTTTKVRIVQANVPQSLKWNPRTALAGLEKHVALTHKPGLDTIQAVIWPETAVPYSIEPVSPLTRDLGRMLPHNTYLITGGMRTEDNESWQAWNSLFVIDYQGNIKAQYDKHHLVPFGEFVPLRHILPVENIAGGIGDFSRGAGPQTLFIDRVPPFSPLICYEAVFPEESTDGTYRAEWLLNITDDAWFGHSSGPYQHLQMARVRAVEQGIPLVRAASTGISAVFDGVGRILGALPLEKEGVLDLYIPHAESEKAIFSRCRYLTILFIIAISVILVMLSTETRRSLS